ncbi:MAG: STAS domain-containing protein [Phycisphaerales bacterium]
MSIFTQPGRVGRFLRPRRVSRVFGAAGDMTEHDRIRDMVRWGESALEAGRRELVVDLSGAEEVDSALLAGLVLLARRARPAGATLRLVGPTERLESLMNIYRLMSALQSAGVVFEARKSAMPKPQVKVNALPASL